MGEVADAVTLLSTTLASTAQSQSSATTSLVSSAQNTLRGLQPPSTSVPFNFPQRSRAHKQRSPQPPDVQVAEYQTPADIPLDPLQELTEVSTRAAPELTFPQAELGEIASLFLDSPDYSFEYWDIDYRTTPLTGVVPEEPVPQVALTPPRSIETEALSGVAPQVPLPDFAEFAFDYRTPYEDQLNVVKAKLQGLHQALQDAKVAFDPADQSFLQLMRGVLDQTVWSIPAEAWAEEARNSEAQDLYAERSAKLKALEAIPPTATGLPSGQRSAERLRLEAETAQKELQLVQKIESTLRDKELEFLKLALSVGVNMTDAAFSLRFQQITLLQHAQQLVVEASKGLIDLITQLVAFKEHEIDLYTRYNDAQLSRTQMAMTIEKTKLEVLRAELGTNELILAHNDNTVAAYSLATRLIEQRLDQRKIENEHALYEKRVELMELDYFNLELEQYKENLQLFLAKQGQANADIRENAVILDGEILKSHVYKAELDQLLANKKVELLNSKVISATNRLNLAQHNEKNNALLTELEAINEVSQTAVKAIMAGVDAEILEKGIETQQQELEDINKLFEARRDLKIRQLNLLNEIKQYSLDMERIKAEAGIMVQGASVAGGIATQAFAGLNGVATDMMTEFA